MTEEPRHEFTRGLYGWITHTELSSTDPEAASPARSRSAALAAGVKLSGLSSSWAAFTVRCAELVKFGGRLGFVLPAELLTTNYAGPVRSYLLMAADQTTTSRAGGRLDEGATSSDTRPRRA